MSIVITQENKIAWEKAIAKAKQVKPRVKVVGFGQFDVTGSKGETYRVEFKRNESGEFEVSCSCKGHTGGVPKPCYHCPPCGSIFKLQVRERAAARSTCTEEGCNGLAVDEQGLCADCLQSSEESRLLQMRSAPAPELYELDCPHCGEKFSTLNLMAFFCPACDVKHQQQIKKDEADLFGVEVAI